MTPKEAYHKAFNSGQRLPELEPIIKKNAEWAYWYVRYVIKGRWPEAETVIVQCAPWAYYYAKNVIKCRWPEAEETIQKNAEYAHYYAKYVIKDRWPEAEDVIAQSGYKSNYISSFFSETVITKDQCSYFEWERVGAVGFFALQRLFERKESLIDMMIENMS